MKRAVKRMMLIPVGVTAFLVSGFNLAEKTETEPVSLAMAISNKWITTEYKGAGSYSGHCINLTAENLQHKKITVNIPAGTMFKPSDDGMQNILVTQEQMLVLEPGVKTQATVRGYCCESTDHAPAKDISFALSENKDPKMAKLFAFLKGKKIEDGLQQEAVWCISNNHEVSDIYAEDVQQAKPLREELCRITGQKDTWYNTPCQHTVDADGNISHVTTEVKGLIKFKALKAAKVHNEIHDATGKLILKNPNEFEVRAGNIEYEFGIKVKGWQKGTYYVEVYENTKVIHKQEFKL
jgi:hypothetical protein